MTVWLRETWVFAGRNVQHIRQLPEKLLDVTMQPLMFVLLFTFVFGGAIDVAGGSYKEYIIGGILVQSLAFGMMGPALTIATDLTDGVIDRFRTLPTGRSTYLSGHFLSELAGLVVTCTVILTGALVVGWRAHTDVLHVLTAFLLLVLFASVMAWIGTLIGLSVRTPDAVMGIGFTAVFPITFLSNAFVPLGSLPAVLEAFATWNPVTVLVAAIRELFGNPTAPVSSSSWPLEHPVLAAFLFCAALLVVVVPLTVRRYRIRTTD
jgi:ABC transporter DrrB family efflux protein